jgi:hypothetical protein
MWMGRGSNFQMLKLIITYACGPERQQTHMYELLAHVVMYKV